MRHATVVGVAALLFGVLAPAQAAVYEGNLRAVWPGGLTRPYPAHLEISTLDAVTGDFTGSFSTTLGLSDLPTTGTESARRQVFFSVFTVTTVSGQPVRTLAFQAAGKLSRNGRRLDGTWESITGTRLHGQMHLRLVQ